ncbi:probable RNA-directed DNA polymerase from transposon BS [Trichonephila clavipes]|nr:probable RNA-directed DNA polymerase from transposon BS [Trichonephila clavipes]
MGNLPKERLIADYPFNCSGVDFSGPFFIKNKGQRKGNLFKVYICIFVCFVFKAVHIELVSDLTSQAFIAVLKRFIARRGKCAKLFSDNGKNFVGASTEIKKLLEIVRKPDEKLANYLAAEGIEWKFMPARSPNFGGLWEAAIKSCKYHLKRVVNGINLTYEELLTVTVQIEGILNSRPLCPLSNNDDDFQVLTPAHFLINRSLNSLEEPNLTKPTLNINISNYTCYRNDRISNGTTPTLGDIEALIQANSNCVIFGDINATHNAWNCSKNSPRGIRLKDFTDDNNLEIAFPKSPTRYGYNSSNTLDFAIISNFNYPYNIVSINDLSSDHNPVMLNFNITTPIHKDNPRAITTCWSAFRKHLKNEIKLFDYAKINNESTLEEKVAKFADAVSSAHNLASKPIKNTRHNYTPQHINYLITCKNKARKLYQQTLNTIHKTEANRLQKLIKKEIRIHAQNTWNAKLESLETQDNSLWHMQKYFRKKRSDIPNLTGPNGIASNDEQKANLIANTLIDNYTENKRPGKHTTNIDSDVTNTLKRFFTTPLSSPISPTDPDEICEYMKKQKNSKAPGIDNITNKMIKNFPFKITHSNFYLHHK